MRAPLVSALAFGTAAAALPLARWVWTLAFGHPETGDFATALAFAAAGALVVALVGRLVARAPSGYAGVGVAVMVASALTTLLGFGLVFAQGDGMFRETFAEPLALV